VAIGLFSAVPRPHRHRGEGILSPVFGLIDQGIGDALPANGWQMPCALRESLFPSFQLAAEFLLQLLETGLQIGRLDRAELETDEVYQTRSHSQAEPVSMELRNPSRVTLPTESQADISTLFPVLEGQRLRRSSPFFLVGFPAHTDTSGPYWTTVPAASVAGFFTP
jgi:hypothetical protein